MSNKIYKFTSPWNKDTLLSEFDSSDTASVSSYNPTWMKTHNVGSYAMSIRDTFPGDSATKPYMGYYWQRAGTEVKPHTDSTANSRINIILQGEDETLHIGGEDIQYDCALLNVSQYEHSVDSASSDRLMFSIIFHNDGDSFGHVENILQTYSYP